MPEERVLRPDDIRGIKATVPDPSTGKIVYTVEVNDIKPMTIGQGDDVNAPGRREALEAVRAHGGQGLSTPARRVLDTSIDALLKGTPTPERFGAIRVGKEEPRSDITAALQALREWQADQKAERQAREVEIMASALGEKPPDVVDEKVHSGLLQKAKERAAADPRFLLRIYQAAMRLSERAHVDILFDDDMLPELREIYPKDTVQGPAETEAQYMRRMTGLAERHEALTLYMNAADRIVKEIRPKDDPINTELTPEAMSRLANLLGIKKKPNR